MNKSLKVGEDKWRKRERRGTKFMPQMRSELWSVISQMIKVEKNAHTRPLFIA